MHNSILSLAEPRARAFGAFQQDLMQVAMDADAGDVAAQVRIESWTVTAKQFASAIERLMIASNAGDAAAQHRIQAIQATLMKEWMDSASHTAANRSRKSMR